LTGLIKVVVRYADGRIFKGYTYDFFPNKATFHLYLAGGQTSGAGTEVNIKDLKCVFFVRDFEGNPGHNEQKQFADDGKYAGRKVEVIFKDGELMTGTTMGYTPNRPGFFLSPVDQMSNNLRVFVVSSVVARVRYL